MTYSTTHLGIGVLLVYFFLPKSSKLYLKNNPKTFLLTSLGAILPDLDLFTNGHRAYGHTVFLPLFIMILGPTLENFIEKENLGKNLRYFGLFWLSHLLFDTTFGPMALFYPIDPRFYNIQAGIVFNLTTTIIAPTGLFFSVEIIDQRNGINSFFVNWTAQDRVNYFGSETINWPISDFFLHSTIFIWYLIFVISPYISQRRGKHEIDTTEIKISSLELNVKPWITTFLLFLLILGFFFAGPYHGQSWVDEKTDSSNLYVLSDTIQLVGSKSFSVVDDTTFEVQINASYENFDYSIFAIQSTPDQIESISSEVGDMLGLYDNSIVSFNQLVNNYQTFIQNTISSSGVVNVSSEYAIDWEFSSKENIDILFGLYFWNNTNSFVNTLKFHAVWNVNISKGFTFGSIFMGLSIVIFAINVYSTNKNLDKT